MEFRTRKREEKRESPEAGASRKYASPPSGTVTLGRLAAAATERARALAALEAVSASGLRPHSEEWRAAALARLRRDGLERYGSARGARDPEFARDDALSHFALGLAFGAGDEARKWFLARETELFSLRTEPESADALAAAEGVRHRTLSPEERRALDPLLRDCSLAGRVHRVHFTDALELVRSRRTLLRDGEAHVTDEELTRAARVRFRTRLSEALAAVAGVARGPSRPEADGRLEPLLRALRDTRRGDAFRPDDSPLPLASLDRAAAACFPPCMRRAHLALRTDHHLKHGARLQYGLFLKAAGLRLADALALFRDEFTKTMDADRFERNYAYGVRHSYGEEGCRKSYSAYGCSKILGASVGPGDAHGCPFRRCDPRRLESDFVREGLSPEDAAAAVALAVQGRPREACSAHFDAKHRTELRPVVDHPNRYFEESRRLRPEAVGRDAESPEERLSSVY